MGGGRGGGDGEYSGKEPSGGPSGEYSGEEPSGEYSGEELEGYRGGEAGGIWNVAFDDSCFLFAKFCSRIKVSTARSRTRMES